VGPPVLDLDLRVRVHQLAEWFADQRIDGVTDLTPGIRSLQVQVDGDRLTVERAIDLVKAADAELPAVDDAVLPSRIVHLPLSWNDPQVLKAIDIYMRSVRPDAPWCPSNLEFIRRINGLDSIDDIRKIAFSAEYVSTASATCTSAPPWPPPLDPRHRLVTTKYNPARTWTPENAVGIGGAYLCVYGMEGPGGYQFVGRTTQVWQRWPLAGEEPWLLRFFDRIRFHPVEADELLDLRADCAAGLWRPEIEDGTLAMADHHRFLDEIAEEAAAAQSRQRAAFAAERADWEARGELAAASAAEVELASAPAGRTPAPRSTPPTCPRAPSSLTAPLAARVWSVPVAEGDTVDADDVLIVLEAMKTETALRAPSAGAVSRVLCDPGDLVTPCRVLAVLEPALPPTTSPSPNPRPNPRPPSGARRPTAVRPRTDPVAAWPRRTADGRGQPRRGSAWCPRTRRSPAPSSWTPKGRGAGALGRAVRRSRTTSTSPAWSPPPAAPPTPTRPTAPRRRCSALRDAGAVLVGKTNLDQFATGLVGTRSPYGTCHSVLDPGS
jgi:urea carboxylase